MMPSQRPTEAGALQPTLRDDFAKEAMNGLLSAQGPLNPNLTRYEIDQRQGYIARRSYEMADAMLVARLK